MTVELEQGSEAWKLARLGSIGASEMADMTARTQKGYGASRHNLMAEKLVERLTGVPTESYTNAAMQWGNDTEPQARAAYEFMNDCQVQQVGLFKHPTIAWTHASPDGLVGDDGLLEIKCPATATHIEYLLGGAVDGKYIKQIQWQLACTGRKWAHWLTFDPRMPAELQMKIVRVERDDAMIAELERETIAFLAELESKLAALEKMRGV